MLTTGCSALVTHTYERHGGRRRCRVMLPPWSSSVANTTSTIRTSLQHFVIPFVAHDNQPRPASSQLLYPSALTILPCMRSGLAMTTIGISLLTNAKRPCFVSPARMPSECIRETSLTFRAASSALA